MKSSSMSNFPPDDSSFQRRHDIEFLESGDEGAEVIYADPNPRISQRDDPASLTTTSSSSPRKEQEEEDETGRFWASPSSTEELVDAGDSVDCSDSLPYSKEPGRNGGMISNSTTVRRLLAFFCMVLVLLAIILGIALGTRDKRKDSTPSSANRDVEDPQQEPEPENEEFQVMLVSNDQCRFANSIMADGVSSVGFIGESFDSSSFHNGRGRCGEATYGQGPGEWYTVPGIRGFLNLTACSTECSAPPDALVIPEVSVFTGSCDGLYCVGGVGNLQESNFEFQVVEGQNYYIYVQGGEGSLGFFEISLSQV